MGSWMIWKDINLEVKNVSRTGKRTCEDTYVANNKVIMKCQENDSQIYKQWITNVSRAAEVSLLMICQRNMEYTFQVGLQIVENSKKNYKNNKIEIVNLGNIFLWEIQTRNLWNNFPQKKSFNQFCIWKWFCLKEQHGEMFYAIVYHTAIIWLYIV